MSAIDSDFSSSDYESTLEIEDRFSLFNMPFSDWVVIKLSNSDLYPQKYQLRHIEEKGSISESLQVAKINVFDRVRRDGNWFLDTLRKIGIFTIAFFTTPVCSFFGVFYHGSLTLKYLVTLLFCKKEEAAHTWQKIDQSARRLLQDFEFCAILAAGAIAPRDLSGLAIIPALINGLRPFSAAELARTSFSYRGTASSFYKSLFLLREFGIVNKTGGCLTNWDPVKDKDLLFAYSYGFGPRELVVSWDPIKDKNKLHLPFASRFYYELTGYFGNLHIEQGRKFVNLIKELQNHLPPDGKFEFSYPPTAKKVADFLEKNRTISVPLIAKVADRVEMNRDLSELSDAEILEWKQKFNTLSEEMTLIGNFLSKSADLTTSGLIRIDLSFPLEEAECITLLKEGPTHKKLERSSS